jgi:predicted ATPase
MIQQLANWIHPRIKTPFEVSQIVMQLSREGVLIFDKNAFRWRLDKFGLTNATVLHGADVAVAQVSSLSPAQSRTLAAAALIGLSFTTAILAGALSEPLESVIENLLPALQRRLVYLCSVPGRYHFAHDRIRKAALDTLTYSQVGELHLAIGRQLLVQWRADGDTGILFEALSHLNEITQDGIANSEELHEIALLNVRAANECRLASVHDAWRFISVSLTIVDRIGWQKDVDLSRAALLEAGRIERQASFHREAKNFHQRLLRFCNTPEQRAEALNELSVTCSLSGHPREALRYTTEALQLFGIKPPDSTNREALAAAFLEAEDLLNKQLMRSKPCQESETCSVISAIFTSALQTAWNLPNELMDSFSICAVKELINRCGYACPCIATFFALASISIQGNRRKALAIIE